MEMHRYITTMEEMLLENEDQGRIDALVLFQDFEKIEQMFSRGSALVHLYYSVGCVRVCVSVSDTVEVNLVSRSVITRVFKIST